MPGHRGAGSVPAVMRGAITGKDVVLHSVSIVRLWGVAPWLSCLWAAITRRESTFLGVLHAATLAAQTLDSAPPHWRPPR